MAEPLSLVTTVTGLVGRALTVSNEIKTTIDRISNAPAHLQAIANDLEDIYSILGTLNGYLDDAEMSGEVLQAAARTNIDNVLENSIAIFLRINSVLNQFKACGNVVDVTTWRKIKYSFKVAEVEALRSELGAHKLTLNMAISLINFINLNAVHQTRQRIESDIATHLSELESKLPLIISQKFEDERALASGAGQGMSTAALESLPKQYDFTLRTYIKNIIIGSSIFSKGSTGSAPSMQISSLGGSEGIQSGSVYISIYETAHTHITPRSLGSTITPDDAGSVFQVTDIVIKTLTNKTYKIPYRANLSVRELKSWLHEQGNFPPKQQRLVAVGKELSEDRDLASYNLDASSTVFMVPSIRGGPSHSELESESRESVAGTSTAGSLLSVRTTFSAALALVKPSSLRRARWRSRGAREEV